MGQKLGGHRVTFQSWEDTVQHLKGWEWAKSGEDIVQHLKRWERVNS